MLPDELGFPLRVATLPPRARLDLSSATPKSRARLRGDKRLPAARIGSRCGRVHRRWRGVARLHQGTPIEPGDNVPLEHELYTRFVVVQATDVNGHSIPVRYEVLSDSRLQLFLRQRRGGAGDRSARGVAAGRFQKREANPRIAPRTCSKSRPLRRTAGRGRDIVMPAVRGDRREVEAGQSVVIPASPIFGRLGCQVGGRRRWGSSRAESRRFVQPDRAGG